MRLLALEHSPRAYRADFICYAAASSGLALTLLVAAPPGQGASLALWAAGGAVGWTLVEYLLHRFVLHGLRPFSRWHAEHHRRPTALIASPTLLSATLFVAGAALPAWWLLGPWAASAVMAGLLGGYLVYGLAHHAVHHVVGPVQRLPAPGQAWLARRRRAHALHHRSASRSPGHYGVTQGWWDWIFGSDTHPPAGP